MAARRDRAEADALHVSQKGGGARLWLLKRGRETEAGGSEKGQGRGRGPA